MFNAFQSWMTKIPTFFKEQGKFAAEYYKIPECFKIVVSMINEREIYKTTWNAFTIWLARQPAFLRRHKTEQMPLKIDNKGVGPFIYKIRTKGDSSKSVCHAYKGRGGLIHLSTYAKKSRFACILLYFHMQGTFIILCCLWWWRPYPLKKFAVIIFLSAKCSTAFFSMTLLLEYLKTFSLEMGVGSDG